MRSDEGKEMRVVVASDIFGRTEAFERLAERVAPIAASCVIIDPYQGIRQSFADEEQAYGIFLRECGHDRYAGRIKAVLGESPAPTIVVAFSVGASSAWRALDRNMGTGVTHLVGFYPSQIRNSLDVVPSCPVTLIFPESEPHFDVGKVIETVSRINGVACVQVPFRHGFMNPASANFDPLGAEQFVNALEEGLGTITSWK
jgi:dienelactone hydrolase